MIDEKLILIGRLTRLHGHRGELQCRLDNSLWEDAETAEWLFLRLDGLDVPFRVLDWRTKGAEDMLFTLKGVDTEEKAQRLVGAEARMLARETNVQESESSLTWDDLVGWTVISSEGEEAVIEAIDTTTANCLARLSGGRLVPLHEDLIRELDETQKRITLTIPLI